MRFEVNEPSFQRTVGDGRAIGYMKAGGTFGKRYAHDVDSMNKGVGPIVLEE